MKRLLCILLLCLLAGSALAEARQVESLDLMPDTGESLFLEEGAKAVYFKDHKAGQWLYISPTERIEIQRRTKASPLLTYYIADIRLAPGTGMFVRSSNAKNPGRSDALPSVVAQREHVVYAQNGDFYSYRAMRKWTVGHIVRDGKILHKKSFSKFSNHLPNLATIAFYPDGNAEINEAWEKTAQQYVNDGARDVLAFGPILIRDGEIPDLNQGAFTRLEPRSCIGMVEPGHFIGLLVEGRNNHSSGANMAICAKLLKE